MASAHGQVGVGDKVKVQDQAGVRGQGSFDMWRDYLNLDPLLKARPGLDHQKPAGAAWGHIQTWQREKYRVFTENSSNENNSAEMSSVSSLSDTCSSSNANRFCGFCYRNGETAQIYRSHHLKSADGMVACPILWNYACPLCGATGDNAHTRRYCPQAERQKNEKKTLRHRFW